VDKHDGSHACEIRGSSSLMSECGYWVVMFIYIYMIAHPICLCLVMIV